MKRWVIAIALVWSTPLALPAAAHARAPAPVTDGLPAMCGDASQTVLFSTAAPAFGSVWQVASLAQHVAADPTSDEGQTAWCVSPDDPRCAPRDTGDTGAPLHSQRSLPPLCDVGSLGAPAPACTETDSVALLARLGAPRAGVGVRLERPPRA